MQYLGRKRLNNGRERQFLNFKSNHAYTNKKIVEETKLLYNFSTFAFKSTGFLGSGGV
jgi:hypothetical protein